MTRLRGGSTGAHRGLSGEEVLHERFTARPSGALLSYFIEYTKKVEHARFAREAY